MNDSALFECVVAEGARRLTTARPNGMGGEIVSWSIDSAFLTSTDGFEFVFIGETNDDRKGLELAPVELLVDGQSMLFGRIDITVRGDKSPGIVTVRGRDYLADLVEGDADPTVSIAAGATLEEAILQICAPYGITHIEGPSARQVARTKAPQKPSKKRRKKQLKDGKPEAGQCVYDWCNRILARHGETLQPASVPHKVVIQAPNYNQDPIGKIVRRDYFEPGNVIRGVATRDFSRCPTFALFAGRQGASTEKSTRVIAGVNVAGNWVEKNGGPSVGPRKDWVQDEVERETVTIKRQKNTWDIGSMAIGDSRELGEILGNWTLGGRRLPGVRSAIGSRALYRLLYWRDDIAKTQEQIDESALRAVAERLKDTLRYEVTLRGIVDPETGYYWACDTIVDVDDDVVDVHERMWIASRRFDFDGQNLTTTLECWRPGSFQIGTDNG